jgi:hypothetical protein
MPDGVWDMQTTGFPLLPSSATATGAEADSVTGKPSTPFHLFFETNGNGTITVTYSGDSVWPSDTAQVDVSAAELCMPA